MRLDLTYASIILLPDRSFVDKGSLKGNKTLAHLSLELSSDNGKVVLDSKL